MLRFALVAFLLIVAPLPAQDGPRLEIMLPAATELRHEGPTVRALSVLADRELRDLLRRSFPVRLHFRVELWSTSGWFDDLEGRREWDVLIQQDPLTREYTVLRFTGDRQTHLGRFTELADADSAIARAYRVPITPPRAGARYYYTVHLDVETLSVSDLDELERWLRGELKPAVQGRRNPGTALTRGVRTLVVRLLGGQGQRLEVRSPSFRAR